MLEAPSLYDEALRYLARRGYPVPAKHLDRDWSQPHAFSPELVPVFETIYEGTRAHWDAYHLCEDLVDMETQFQLWRFRHMRTVMRIIGFKKGTGGSSGVGFLRQALELTFFPELFEVRTVIGVPGTGDPPRLRFCCAAASPSGGLTAIRSRFTGSAGASQTGNV